MIRYLKKAGLLIVLIGILISNVPKVSAKASWGVAFKTIAGGGGGGYEEILETKNVEETEEMKITTSCKYEQSGGVIAFNSHTVNFSAYNEKDEDIMEAGFYIKEENSPKAGMAIGLTIEEERHIYWDIKRVNPRLDIQIQKKEKIYECKYKNNFLLGWAPTKPVEGGSGIVLMPQIQVQSTDCSKTEEVVERQSCPTKQYCTLEQRRETGKVKNTTVYNNQITVENQDYISGYYKDVIDEEFTKCKEEAIARAQRVSSYYTGASYNIELSDSNDINGTDSVKISSKDTYAKYYKYQDGTGKNLFREFLENNGYGVSLGYAADMLEDERTEVTCRDQGCFMKDGSYKIRDENGELIEVEAISIYTYYEKKGTCLNLRTGKVRYLDGKTLKQCDPNTEIKIENTTMPDGSIHWHYFLPLNAKSIDDIIIDMQKPDGESKLDSDTCIQYMKQQYISTNGNSEDVTYDEVIRPINSVNAKFAGDYKCSPKGNKNCDNPSTVTWNDSHSLDYLEVKKNGCILSTKKEINVKQKFYNETTSNKLNGFNFYYKPIDTTAENQVDMVFPNGIKKDLLGNISISTLWEDWYKYKQNPTPETKINELDLSKSYETISYIAENISANKVKNYNNTLTSGKKNVYTSWLNMNLDGTSNFITNEGIVTRISDPTTKIYKLGCGPSNSFEYYDEAKTNKNILYRKECDLE